MGPGSRSPFRAIKDLSENARRTGDAMRRLRTASPRNLALLATTVAARSARFRGDAVRSRLIASPVLRAFSDKSLIARKGEREPGPIDGHAAAVALGDRLDD